MTETIQQAPAFPITIWVAGDAADAERICRRYCMDVPLCVTVTPTTYVYTGGAEAGVRVGLTNYPRFPAEPEDIQQKAFELARRLRDGLCQWSVMVETPTQSYWLSTREERGNRGT